MSKKYTSISVDGGFASKFVRDLGLLRYCEDFDSAFFYELQNAYGDEHLEGSGLTYHDVEVFDEGQFFLFGTSALLADQSTVAAWKTLVITAKAALCHNGGLTHSIEVDWNIEIDIGTADASLPLQVWVKVSRCALKSVTLYNENGSDFEKEWSIFLLRYL